MFMIAFVNMLVEKRRLIVAAIAIAIPLFLISVLAPVVQAHQPAMAAQVQATHDDQGTMIVDDGPNAVQSALSALAVNSGNAIDTIKIQTLSGVITTAAAVTHVNKAVAHGAYAATAMTFRGIGIGLTTTARATGDCFSFTGHTLSSSLGFFAGMTHVSALIRPSDNTPTPTITQMRAQQAGIIQSGTTNAVVPTLSSGTGGACDIGQGNGSYPLNWCDAPMDSIATISYTTDPINRECTSYASWYFTSVEGHTDFHASGNAKYWAATSNYPTYAAPAVGAIAVETVGAYGHVAIVQALPGQTYEGQLVPAGDVLVSEMNYDWQGHFRYSYSPVSKFAAYIYP
jgi:hypothetical protein